MRITFYHNNATFSLLESRVAFLTYNYGGEFNG